jgi:hemophore-related protein
MVKHTPAGLAVVVCALALASTAGAGVASAEPDLTPLMTTTCTYSQAVAALNAASPDGGAEYSANPQRQTWLHAFLDSPVEQRRQLVQQQAPLVDQYAALLVAMANTCKNYPAV